MVYMYNIGALCDYIYIIYIYMYDTHLNISQSKGRHPNPSRLHSSASCFTSVTRGERTESLGKWYPVWARLGFALMISAVGLPSGDRRDRRDDRTWHRTGEGREIPEVMIPAWRLYLIKRSLETWSVGDSCSLNMVS